MGSIGNLEKMQLRQSYANVWHSDLTSTCGNDPLYCCFSCFCPHCVSYLLRERALYNDMSRYTCCAGYMPCSGRCGEADCPEFCLATEGFMLCLNQIACICSIVEMCTGCDVIEEASRLLNCLAEMVQCTVCACMQTQHKIEMDKREGLLGPQVMQVPPVQQMSRLDQAVPPAVVGYPQPAVGRYQSVQQPGYPAPGQPYLAPYPPPRNPNSHLYPPPSA